jgi:DNA-binding XRE family transcriptional regulator
MIDVHRNWLRPDPPPQTCAELLIGYRKRIDLNQTTAAKGAGIAVSVLGYCEQGKRPPTWEMLVKVIDFYNLDSMERYELFDAVEAAVRQEVAA